MSFFISFVLTMYLMPKFVKWARSKKASQPIYELAPESHRAKVGTPTMGGVVFIFATIVATVLTAKLSNFYIVGGLLCLALFSLIGIQDDYSKISKAKNDAGLSARAKLILQFLAAAIVGYVLYYFGAFFIFSSIFFISKANLSFKNLYKNTCVIILNSFSAFLASKFAYTA